MVQHGFFTRLLIFFCKIFWAAGGSSGRAYTARPLGWPEGCMESLWISGWWFFALPLWKIWLGQLGLASIPNMMGKIIQMVHKDMRLSIVMGTQNRWFISRKILLKWMGTPISGNLQMAWDGHHITMMTMIVINTASPIGKTYDGKQQYGHYDYDLWLLSHPCCYRDWSNGKIEIWRIISRLLAIPALGLPPLVARKCCFIDPLIIYIAIENGP